DVEPWKDLLFQQQYLAPTACQVRRGSRTARPTADYPRIVEHSMHPQIKCETVAYCKPPPNLHRKVCRKPQVCAYPALTLQIRIFRQAHQRPAAANKKTQANICEA